MGASISSEVLVVKNVFERVDEPYRYQAPAGLLRAVSNATINCSNVLSFNDPVFTPPYFYTMDETNLVAEIVTNNAGAGRLGFNGAPFEAWQLQYFDCIICPQAAATADPDGDGLSNTNEFLAGTNPTNSASFFGITAIAKESDDIRVTWMTGTGQTNALERTAGAAGSYTNDFAAIFTATNTAGTTTNYTDTGGATNVPAQYYRIRLVP